MIIAINLTHFVSEVNKNFNYELFKRIARENTIHQFIFITARKSRLAINHPSNIIEVISGPRANTVLFWKIWYDYTLPALIRKYKATTLVNTDGACSLRTKTRQCLFINDLYFLNEHPFSNKKQVGYIKKNGLSFLNKAAAVMVGSAEQKKQIIERYNISEAKIEVLQFRVSDLYQPLNFNEKTTIKEAWAGGKEYFLFTGEIHPRNNLMNLLKAFSFFKKRQKSNMQLLIATGAVEANDPFIESLKTYKYRNEIKLLFDLSESEKSSLIAAAYTLVYPAFDEVFPVAPLQAIQCEVPLIVNDTATLKEICGDAALYMDAENFQSIADKMMKLFKDENKRSELVNQAAIIASGHRNNQPGQLLWQSIKAVADN